MSDYSFSYPCAHVNLTSEKADELRIVCDTIESSDNYIIQLQRHLSLRKPVPFGLIKAVLKNHMSGTALHRWISDCEFVLPEVIIPPRNQELEQRCQKLRAQELHTEHNRVVKGIDKNVDAAPGNSGVWREIRNQYIAVINMVLTIGGTFAFVYRPWSIRYQHRTRPPRHYWLF